MTKFIPKEKLSKKKQRELNAQRRVTWPISPVTRRSDDPKIYNRSKAKNWKQDSSDPSPCIFRETLINSTRADAEDELFSGSLATATPPYAKPHKRARVSC